MEAAECRRQMEGSEFDRQKCAREYRAFRERYPKTDVTFLDEEQRKHHIADDETKLRHFVGGLKSIADKAQQTNGTCMMFLDVEGDYRIPGETTTKPEPYYWHKQQLANNGL